jgi:hypothetical protein
MTEPVVGLISETGKAFSSCRIARLSGGCDHVRKAEQE